MMRRYIDRDALCKFARNHKDGTIDCNDIMRFPTTEIEELTPRYIDANAAIKSFKDLHIEGNCYTSNFIVEFLEKQSTADVQEVKHAHWVHYGEDIQCSNCGNVSDDIGYKGDMDSGYYTVLPHYCNNCGCKMLEDK